MLCLLHDSLLVQSVHAMPVYWVFSLLISEAKVCYGMMTQQSM